MHTEESSVGKNKTYNFGTEIRHVILYNPLKLTKYQNLKFEIIPIRNDKINLVYVSYGKLRNESSKN